MRDDTGRDDPGRDDTGRDDTGRDDTGRNDTLAADRLVAVDDGGRPVLVLLHGFAQTRRCWGPLAEGLAADRTVVAVDLPGHGGSTRAADADLDRTVDLLGSTLAGLDGPLDVLGYSMGGRVALTWMVTDPGRIRRLVTIGATAGITDTSRRAERRDADEERARRVERDGVDGFVEWWLGLPMFAGLPDWARFDEERRGNSADALAASLRNAGTGSMRPLWDDLAALGRSGGAPALLALAGGDDPDYVAHAARLAADTGGRAVTIPGAGHAAHLERPDETLAAVRRFLDG